MRNAFSGFMVIFLTAGFFSGCGYNQLQQQEEKVFRAWSARPILKPKKGPWMPRKSSFKRIG